MKSIFVSLIFILGLSYTQAQVIHGFNLDSLKISLEENPDIYPNLSKRLIQLDTTLTEAECFILYYGSAFQDNYSPYSESFGYKAAYDLIEEGEYAEAIEVTNGLIAENPTYIKAYSEKAYAHRKLGQKEEYIKCIKIYYMLLSVPYRSGTGESYDSAFVVKSVADEYLIISELGMSSSGQSLNYHNGMPYDILHVKDRETGESSKIYFNVSSI